MLLFCLRHNKNFVEKKLLCQFSFEIQNLLFHFEVKMIVLFAGWWQQHTFKHYCNNINHISRKRKFPHQPIRSVILLTWKRSPLTVCGVSQYETHPIV